MSDYSSLRSRAQRTDLAATAPLTAPFTVFVEPTNLCNFSCSFCPESFPDYVERSGGTHHLTLEAWEHIANEISDLLGSSRLKTLNFYMMGEPLANPSTPDFIRSARERGLAEHLILTTNGSLLSGKRAERLLDAAPDFVRVSIYGADDEHHARITSSRVPLTTVRNNVRAFRDLRDRAPRRLPHLYVKMIDQGPHANARFLEAFADCADEIEIEPVMNWNDPDGASLSGLSQQDLLSTDYFKQKKSVCPSPFYTLVIHSDLQVSVCCVDWAKQAVVGDLKGQSLREIWWGDSLHEFRLLHLERRRSEIPACANCTYLHTFPDVMDSLSATDYRHRLKLL